MPVVRLTLAYDGTDFRGWQRQAGQRTIQGVLEDALSRVLGDVPALSAAGRTDAGVHARAQVVSFQSDAEPVTIQRAVNGMLGPEVVATDARIVRDGFDARFSATAREYRYRIDVGAVPNPFVARFVWHHPGDLALAEMRRAASLLVGEHDFASFCRRPPDDRRTVRDVERLSIVRNDTRIEIAARANAFLHQMVRSLVGTLVAVGEGRVAGGSMPQILEARDRSAAGGIAPPHGLTLERVFYGRA
jgi:tRNA pseudouridine38-40 synthase